MISFKRLYLVAIAIMCMSAAVPSGNNYTLTKGYTVTIAGTSNLHDWNETVGKVTGTGKIKWNSDGSFDLSAMNIKMAVRSIKSSEGAIMNNNTYKALKSADHPNIIFALAEPVRSHGGAIAVKINLSIAGVTRTIDMTVKATIQGRGSVTFEGSKTIKMTDYDIKPPVALLGTLRTGNDITIQFKTVFLGN